MSNIIEQRTVTIPLEEYLLTKENSETLSKALHERKIICEGNSMGGDWYRYFIADESEVINKIKVELLETKQELNRKNKELNELRNEAKRHYDADERRYISLSRTFNEYTSASLWTRIMRVFNKQY